MSGYARPGGAGVCDEYAVTPEAKGVAQNAGVCGEGAVTPAPAWVLKHRGSLRTHAAVGPRPLAERVRTGGSPRTPSALARALAAVMACTPAAATAQRALACARRTGEQQEGAPPETRARSSRAVTKRTTSLRMAAATSGDTLRGWLRRSASNTSTTAAISRRSTRLSVVLNDGIAMLKPVHMRC